MSERPAYNSRTSEEILQLNLDACQNLLKRNAPNQSVEFELLKETKLDDTPFEITAALVWAYKTIIEQEQSIRLAVDLNKRALSDNTALNRELCRIKITIAQAISALNGILHV